MDQFSCQQSAGGEVATTRVPPMSEPCCEKHVPHSSQILGLISSHWSFLCSSTGVSCLYFTSSLHGKKISKINYECNSVKLAVLRYGRYKLPTQRHWNLRHHIEASCKTRVKDILTWQSYLGHHIQKPGRNWSSTNFLIPISTDLHSTASSTFVTHTMNSLLFAVKLLPELTPLSFRSG